MPETILETALYVIAVLCCAGMAFFNILLLAALKLSSERTRQEEEIRELGYREDTNGA